MASRTNALMVKELVAYLDQVADMVFLGYSGMTAQEVDRFRAQLASGGGRMRIVKNSVTKIALEQAGRGDVAGLIDGPVAILHGADVVAVAKEAVALRRSHKTVEIKGAVVDGTPLTAAQVLSLTRLPSRIGLLGQIAAQVVSPGRNVSSAAGSGGANLAACVKKRIEDLEKGAA